MFSDINHNCHQIWSNYSNRNIKIYWMNGTKWIHCQKCFIVGCSKVKENKLPATLCLEKHCSPLQCVSYHLHCILYLVWILSMDSTRTLESEESRVSTQWLQELKKKNQFSNLLLRLKIQIKYKKKMRRNMKIGKIKKWN